MLGHVEAADKDAHAFQLGEDHGQASRQDVSLAYDADEHDVCGSPVPLHDLVCDARQRPADLVRIHHSGFQPSLGDAHVRMTDSPETARDSGPRWPRWEEPTSTATRASVDA